MIPRAGHPAEAITQAPREPSAQHPSENDYRQTRNHPFSHSCPPPPSPSHPPPLVRPILASSSIVRDSISRRYLYRNPVRSVFPSFTSLVSSRATISRRQSSYCLLPFPLFQRDERLAPINILVLKRVFVAFGHVRGKHVHRYVVVFETFCRTFGIERVAIASFAAYFFFHSDEQDRSDSFGNCSRSLYC